MEAVNLQGNFRDLPREGKICISACFGRALAAGWDSNRLSYSEASYSDRKKFSLIVCLHICLCSESCSHDNFRTVLSIVFHCGL